MVDDYQLVNEHYASMMGAIQQRNYPRAVGYLRMIYQQLSFHFSTYRQVKFDGLSERDALRLLTTYIREFADDPSGYMMLAHYYYYKRQYDQVRKVWTDACANVDKGFHFQPSILPTIFDFENRHPFTSLSETGLSEKVTDALSALKQARPPAPVGTRKVAENDLAVVTAPGEPIGLDGVALNGRLAGFTQPTRYYFRYGAAPDQLTETTEPRDMPAGRCGRTRDTAENFLKRIGINALNLSAGSVTEPDQTTQFPMVYIKAVAPFGKDRNHRDGIGVIDLLLGWANHAQRRGLVAGDSAPEMMPTPAYPGEAVDLRDAQVTVKYRSEDMDTRAFSPVIWMHGRTGTAVFPDEYDDLSAWAVTAAEHAETFIADGTWRTLTFDVPALSTDWSFCGSNVEEMGDGMLRYTYAPIQDLQRENMGGNFCIAFIGGNELDTPEGSLEIAELELTYRSRSLLGPDQQAELVEGPDDAGCLTDGTLGDIEHAWHVAVPAEKPVDLVWRLRGEAEVTAFKVHQNVIVPSHAIEIAVSEDGNTFTEVWEGTMEAIPEDPMPWGEMSVADALILAIVLEAPVTGRFVRLRIKSGQRANMAGLDAFEVFGEGLPFIPSGEDFTFSEAVAGLDGGGTLYAQLVAENEDGVFEGDVVEILRPVTGVPCVLSVTVASRSEEAAKISVRVIGMDETARLYVSLTSADGETAGLPTTRITKWHVPADNAVLIDGLKPGLRYTATLEAENVNGAAAPVTIEIPPLA